MPDPKLDAIGRWSEIKLDIIRDYACEYTKILSKQKFIKRFVYVDAFAGAGKHVSKASGDFVAGSPANALNVTPSFSEYHFIDLDESRVGLLEELAQQRPNVHVYHGDCNKVLLSDVFPRCEWGDYARALCLLDPYKLIVDWEVLATAGSMKSVEIFYNFMIMDANMNMLLKNPDKAAPAQLARLDKVWGDGTWRDVAYSSSGGLFPDIEMKQSNERIAEAFRTRLRDVAGFQYVPAPIAMRNSTGAIVYYLYFASNKPVAEKIVKHIFKKHGG